MHEPSLKNLRFFRSLSSLSVRVIVPWLSSLFRCTHTLAQVWVSVHPIVIFMFHAHRERWFWFLLLLFSLLLLLHPLSLITLLFLLPDIFSFLNVVDKYPTYFRWGPWHPGRERFLHICRRSGSSGTSDRTCGNPQSDPATAMKLKIKDLDYVKELGQQSRTTSTQSLVLSKQLWQGQLRDVEQAVLTRMWWKERRLSWSWADNQLLDPPIETRSSSGSDTRCYRDSTTQHGSDINCLNVFRSRKLMARITMTTYALRFGWSREGKTTTWFSRTSVGSGPTMYQVFCCERRWT